VLTALTYSCPGLLVLVTEILRCLLVDGASGEKSATSLSVKLTILVGKWAAPDGHLVMEFFDPHDVKSLRHVRENRYPPQFGAVLFKERVQLRCRFPSGLESTVSITENL
jgi:hypothetical protein